MCLIEGSAEPYCVVIGGINIDIQGFCNAAHIEKDSNPGVITRNLGGVGRNIAENLVRLGMRTELITVLGNSPSWDALISRIEHLGISLSHSPRLADVPLPTYLCILERDGGLVSAVADMRAIEKLQIEHLESQDSLLRKAACIIVDGNLPKVCIEWIAHQYHAANHQNERSISKIQDSTKQGNVFISRDFADSAEKIQDKNGDRGLKNAQIPSLIAESQRPILIADPVSTSKALKFRDCFGYFDIAKPNLAEARAIANCSTTATPSQIIATLKAKSNLPTELYLSLGENGMLVIEDDSVQEIPLPEQNLRPPSANRSGAGDAACAALAWISARAMLSEKLKSGQFSILRPSIKAKFALSAALIASASKRPVNRKLDSHMLCERTKICYPELSDLVEYLMQNGGII